MSTPTQDYGRRSVKRGIDTTAQASVRAQAQVSRSKQKQQAVLQTKRAQAPVGTGSDEKIRGVTSRSVELWALFRDLARGDFRHDFNERVATRDLITGSDENRFMEIAKQVSKRGTVWLRTKFKESVGDTIFNILNSTFDKALVPTPSVKPAAVDPEFYDEEDLLSKVGVDFAAIKTEMDTWTPDKAPVVKEFTIPGGITRSYTLRSSSYRLGKRGEANYKQNRNITQMFREVTGGKNKFALIVDASGGLPLTEIQNTTLEPYAPGGEFYFIENIENDADSATKLSGVKAKEGESRPAPKVVFLKDTANTVVYPLWDVATDPKSNIYSKLKIALNRVDSGEIEANILIVDDSGKVESSISIGDVSNSSNVKNATLHALAVYLEKGLVTEAFVYTLIKRMGDWCQAISMLDLDRQYETTDTTLGKTTLRDMLVDTEIGVVTNDRILLAFCILLGLNVYYTTAMDVARLIYFKNNNDIPEGPALESRAAQIYKESALDANTSDLHVKSVSQAISQYKAQLLALAPTELPTYVFKLKNFLSNVGKLRYSFSALKKQYSDAKSKYDGGKSAMDKFNAANAMYSTKTKIQLDIDYNTQTLRDMSSELYPGSPADKIRLDALTRKLATGGRVAKSVEVTETKNILLGVRDDIKQVIGKKFEFLTAAGIAELFAKSFKVDNEKLQFNYDEILGVLPAIKAVISGGGQTGGGYESTDTTLAAIRTRLIRLLPKEVEEQTSTVNIYKRGDEYVDEKLRAYTVSDDRIVTSDDLPAFNAYFQGMDTDPPIEKRDAAVYICLKYALLRRDIESTHIEMMRTESEGLEVGSDGAREDPGTFEPGSVGSQQRMKIYSCLVKLNALAPNATFFADIRAIFNKTYEEIEPPVGVDILATANETRQHLLALFGSVFPPTEDPAEVKETAAIEQNAKSKFDIVQQFMTYIVADIVQFSTPYLNLKPADFPVLALYIEDALADAAAEDEMSDTFNLDAVIAKAYGAWMTDYRAGNQAPLTTLLPLLNGRIQSKIAQLASPPVAVGGNRRPLYTKRDASRTSDSSTGTPDDAGLRQRTRSRSTSRVREHAGKSSTRRSRGHVDRV